MFEEMIRIARNELVSINEKADGLPAPQVTVLLTGNNNIYVATNDIDGSIRETLQHSKDTKIVKMVTMWKEGGVDLPSIGFRNALIELDVCNNDTDIILQGKDGVSIKKLAVTLP